MFNYLRELNFVSVALRLLLSAVIGFSLGMERGRKHRPAGCRTYMLVCMGATLTLLLSQYESMTGTILRWRWASARMSPASVPRSSTAWASWAPAPFWSPDAGR